MEITGIGPDGVDIELRFIKPWKSTNQVRLEPGARPPQGTDVTWTMTASTTGLMGLFEQGDADGPVVGKDFEKGLARLKAVAEQTA